MIYRSRFFLASLVLMAPPVVACAAGPEAELLRLTPKEATFCVVVRDVRGFSKNVLHGPLAEAFRRSSLGAALAVSPEVAQIESLTQQVSKALQLEWSQVRDDVFGDVIVLAYQNGPPGKPEDERGLALTWARDPKTAALLIERLNQAQKTSGELREVRRIEYKSAIYYERVKNKGPNEFYFLNGSVLAFAPQESMLKRAIELDQELPPADTAPPPLAAKLEQAGAGGLATILLNPRSFDAEFTNRAKLAEGQEKVFLAGFSQLWSALDSVALNLRVEKDFELSLAIATRKDAIPPALLKFAQGFNDPSAIWSAVPDDAILAIASRSDFPAFLDALAHFMAPEARKTLQASIEQGLGPVFGKKLLPSLPAHFGPDWGICISPPRSSNAVLPEVLAGVRVAPGDGNRVERAILDALNVGVTLVRTQINAKLDEPIRLETKQRDGVAVTYLAHDTLFPPGFQPAYAIRNGFLLLASHPDRILNTTISPIKPDNASVRLAIVSFHHLRAYLSTRRNALADLLAARQSTPGGEVLAQIDKILTAIELFDRVELFNTSQRPGELKLTLKVAFTQPLKK